MKAAAPERHAATEADWERDPATVAWAGTRPVQYFWPMLAPYFRGVLLAPRRRAGAGAVTWQWTEPSGSDAVSAGELRVLRGRLAGAQERLAENLAVPDRRRADFDQLVPAMARLTAAMAEWSDDRLAAHACRAEGGWRLHTWGTSAPPAVRYADGMPPPAALPAVASAPAPRRRRRVAIRLFAAATIGVMLLWIRKNAPPETRGVAREAEAPRATFEAGLAPAAGAAAAVRPSPPRRLSAGNPGEFGAGSGTGEPALQGATTVAVAPRPPAGLATTERIVPMPASLLVPGIAPGQAAAGADAPLTGTPTASPENADVSPAQPSPSVERGEISVAERTAPERAARDLARLETRAAAVSFSGTPPPGDVLPWSDKTTEPLAEAAETAENETPVKTARAVAAGASAAISRVPAALGQTLRVPWRTWQLRLVVDAIVPTLPMAAGRAPDTSGRRSRLLAKRQARVPSALRAAVLRAGFDFERDDPATVRPERWTWSADATAEPATGQSGRTLAAAVPEAVATVRYEAATHTLVLRVADGVRVTVWFEVASMPRDWRWQTASGAPLSAAGAARLAYPLRAGAEQASAQPAVVLVDPESGWGLVGGL